MDNNHRNSLLLRYWTLSVLLILVGIMVWYVRALIAPLMIAGLLAFVLNPLVDFIAQRIRIPRSLVIFFVSVIWLGAAVALVMLIFPVLLEEIDTLSGDLGTNLEVARRWLERPIMVFQWRIYLDRLIPDFSGLLSEQITSLPENVLQIIEATTLNMIWILVILVTTYYLLRDWARLRDWLLSLPPESYQPIALRIYQEIKQVWNGYLRGNVVLMAIVGVVFSLVWLAIGLPGALILGIVAGMLTIIPDLGPAIAAGIAVLVALLEGSSYLPISNFWFAVLVLGLYLLLVNIKSIWLRPRIYGHSVHMHDGIVFVAIMAAVVVQGILGALIVIPVLASLGVIGKYVYRGLLGMPLWEEPQDQQKAEQVDIEEEEKKKIEERN